MNKDRALRVRTSRNHGFLRFGCFLKLKSGFYYTNLEQIINSRKLLNLWFKHISLINDPKMAIIIPIIVPMISSWFPYHFPMILLWKPAWGRPGEKPPDCSSIFLASPGSPPAFRHAAPPPQGVGATAPHATMPRAATTSVQTMASRRAFKVAEVRPAP